MEICKSVYPSEKVNKVIVCSLKTINYRSVAYLIVGDLEKLQDHTMGFHVPQKSLLMFLVFPCRGTVGYTKTAQALQYLAVLKQENNLIDHTCVGTVCSTYQIVAILFNIKEKSCQKGVVSHKVCCCWFL